MRVKPRQVCLEELDGVIFLVHLQGINIMKKIRNDVQYLEDLMVEAFHPR